MMEKLRFFWLQLVLLGIIGIVICAAGSTVEPKRILLDTDLDTDDILALFYILKQKRSKIDLKAITVSANAWSDSGHAVNQLYDILYMMDRDDIVVGVGGDGGILLDGTIQENVGGYFPIIDQGLSTAGDCRYRQAIPVGQGGRLDIDTNFGIRKEFLPQGYRKYSPLKQPTVQQVMKDAISRGPITVFLIGSHTNLALFLMSNPDLKKNIEHIFIMGGGVRSKNPTGNLFSARTTNPYAEFNIFSDPFAAYQVFHSGIPITVIPLDATNDIPLTEEFFQEFEMRQDTYEAKYCFQSLKRTREGDTDDQFFAKFFMWDSFMSGVAISIIQNGFPPNGENEFAEMEYLNITVITSNVPYGISDGSNPFFDSIPTPKFNLQKNGVHSGHVQMGIEDSFCTVDNKNKKGICQDGYTKEVNDSDGVQVLVAQNAKRNKNSSSLITRQFYGAFLEVLNHPQQSARFNLAHQFPFYRQILYKPEFSNRKLGKLVIFDMDMSIGDFLALIYLLKIPVNKLHLKGILISGNGWANAGTIDIVYDVLHMMGRDDIPIGLGALTPLEVPSSSCKYVRAIPQGSGGFLDSDTLFGFARDLPKSPRRYTSDNSMLYRQALASEIWENVSSEVLNGRSRKITVLTSGPLTNLANIILKNKTSISSIQDVYIVGGHIADESSNEKGNVFTIPSNQHSEFNFFLDPIAAKKIIEESNLSVKLIPLNAQRKVASFPKIMEKLESSSNHKTTPESNFAYNLISTMYTLQQQNGGSYHHVVMFLGEILGAVFLANDSANNLNATIENMSIDVLEGDVSTDGHTIFRKKGSGRNLVNVLKDLDSEAYFNDLVDLLSSENQSSVVRSFDEQRRQWSTPLGNDHVGNDLYRLVHYLNDQLL